MTAQALLSDVFGFDGFRPGQQEIAEAVTAGENVLAIMPTGGGKSLCFQLPALMREGVTVVISPLIALMRDQVEGLRALGVEAGALTSGTRRKRRIRFGKRWKRSGSSCFISRPSVWGRDRQSGCSGVLVFRSLPWTRPIA